MNVNWITMALIALSGILFLLFNELEDESVRDNWKKHKQFLNKKLSWKNKWKLNPEGFVIENTKKHWYYFSIDPKYVEKFYLSSTILVFLTDGEHLFQFFKKRFIELGFLLIGWEFAVAWAAGTMIMQFTKEKFIKFIS